jgi:hypothetical protein
MKTSPRWRNIFAEKISEIFGSNEQHRGPCKNPCCLWVSAVTEQRASSFRSFVNKRNICRQIALSVWDLRSPSRWIWRWRSPAVDDLFSSRKVPTLPINTLPYGSVYLLPWRMALDFFLYVLIHYQNAL